MPPISSSGISTATSEMLIETMVKPISPAPLKAASQRLHAFLDIARDVLEHDDGIVDDEADRDRQRHQRQVVERVAGTHISAQAPSSASGTVTSG